VSNILKKKKIKHFKIFFKNPKFEIGAGAARVAYSNRVIRYSSKNDAAPCGSSYGTMTKYYDVFLLKIM
jgi:hypothetical protein